MNESNYPAGAGMDNEAPFNRRDNPECPTCEGKGVVSACCTGAIAAEVVDFCPQCMEHLVGEPCLDCEGVGMMTADQLRDEEESHREDMKT